MTIVDDIVARRVCSKCGEWRDVSLFQHFNGRPSGQCRLCKSEAERARRRAAGKTERKQSVIVGDQKLCLECNQMHPITNFSPTRRGLGGVSSYCRACFSRKVKLSDVKVREATARYRAAHPERHRVSHRLRMFERRRLIKVTSDGSVTDEFLKALYDTPDCTYCLKTIPSKKRTADHMTSLHRGGTHTAGNLCMACSTCNSAKQDLSADEFMEIIRN